MSTSVDFILERINREMAAQKISIGDAVVIASGSPVMTVEFIEDDGDGQAYLVYWDPTLKEFQKHEIAVGALRKVPDVPPK